MRTLITDLCPAIDARPISMGWGPMAPTTSMPFADIWWRFYVNNKDGMTIIGPGARIPSTAIGDFTSLDYVEPPNR